MQRPFPRCIHGAGRREPVRDYAITLGDLVAMDSGGNLGLEWLWKSRSEGRVRSSVVVVRHPFPQNPSGVRLTDRDHPIKTLPTDRADQSLTERIRFRRANWRLENPNTKVLQSGVESYGEDRIAIVDHEQVRMVEDKELAELLHRPFSRWMRRDIDMENSPRADLHGDKDIQNPESRCRTDEEIARDDRL